MATVRKRGNGYRIRVYHGYDITGKQIVRSKTWTPPSGMTEKQAKKEADIQAALFEDAIRNGDLGNGNIRFADFATEWLDSHARRSLKEKTVAEYSRMLPKLNTAFGHVPINQLQPLSITKFYNTLSDSTAENAAYVASAQLKEELRTAGMTQQKCAELAKIGVNSVWSACNGRNVAKTTAKKISEVLKKPMSQLFELSKTNTLSVNTVRHYHRLLSSILGMAVKWQFIQYNPCSRVIMSKKDEERKLSYLDDEQAKQLLKLLGEEKRIYRLPITLLLLTGVRKGELLGFEWKDVNWEAKSIEVKRTVQYTKAKGVYVDTPKNKSSRRIVYVSDAVMEVLKDHREWQLQQKKIMKKKWISSDRIVVMEDGKPMNPNCLANWFGRFVKRTDFPSDLHLHSLRHTYATLCIAQGVPLTAVAAQLGHANVETTSRIYAHAIKKNQIEAADMIAKALTSLLG